MTCTVGLVAFVFCQNEFRFLVAQNAQLVYYCGVVESVHCVIIIAAIVHPPLHIGFRVSPESSILQQGGGASIFHIVAVRRIILVGR